MEKKLLKLIIAGVVLALILGAALVVLNRETKAPESGVKVFVDRDAAQIRSLHVKNENAEYRVYFDEAEDGYVFDDIPASVLDVDGFFALMHHAAGFGAIRQVEEHADDLSVYGLTAPRAFVEVTYTDGGSYAMEVGAEEPVSGNFYVRVLTEGTENAVYLFAREDILYFLQKKEAYISDLVTPELAVSSPLSAVRDITFSGSALQTPVSVTAVSGADPDTVLDAKSFGPATHLVHRKGVYELDQTYGIEVLGSVLGIHAMEVAAYNVTEEDLSSLGFDDPYMQVDFTLKNGTDYVADYQLKLVPQGAYYLASMLGTQVVYRIEPPAFVSLDPDRLCLRWFLSPLRADLRDLTVEFDGETYVYTSDTDAEDNVVAQVNGKPMDTEQFFRLYRLATSASSDGKYLDVPVHDKEPVMTLTYHYNIKGKEPDVMKLYPGSLRRVEVEINSVTEYDMREAFVTAMKQACRNSLTGEKIEENW